MTAELKESCQDLKVLGKRELTNLLKWRMSVRREYEKSKKSSKIGDENAEHIGKNEMEEHIANESKIDWELEEVKNKLQREEKAKAKKLKEEKKKASWRKKMSMTSFVSDEPDLFFIPSGLRGVDEALASVSDDGGDISDDDEWPALQHRADTVDKTGDWELDRIAEMEAEEIL